MDDVIFPIVIFHPIAESSPRCCRAVCGALVQYTSIQCGRGRSSQDGVRSDYTRALGCGAFLLHLQTVQCQWNHTRGMMLFHLYCNEKVIVLHLFVCWDPRSLIKCWKDWVYNFTYDVFVRKMLYKSLIFYHLMMNIIKLIFYDYITIENKHQTAPNCISLV